MKKLLALAAYALLIGGLGYGAAQNINRSVQLSQSPLGPIGVDSVNGVYFPAKLNTAGLSPTLAGCGTSPSNNGSDLAGNLQVGTGVAQTCTLTFRTAYTSTPYCTGSVSQATPMGVYSSPNGVNFIFGTGATHAGDQINYTCIGRSTG